jgi:hypothetical protein
MNLKKRQSIAEPQTSSTALTLQQLNKKKEKKEAAAEAAKSRCRICFKETAPTPYDKSLQLTKKTETEDVEKEIFNPSPFSKKMNPW